MDHDMDVSIFAYLLVNEWRCALHFYLSSAQQNKDRRSDPSLFSSSCFPSKLMVVEVETDFEDLPPPASPNSPWEAV